MMFLGCVCPLCSDFGLGSPCVSGERKKGRKIANSKVVFEKRGEAQRYTTRPQLYLKVTATSISGPNWGYGNLRKMVMWVKLGGFILAKSRSKIKNKIYLDISQIMTGAPFQGLVWFTKQICLEWALYEPIDTHLRQLVEISPLLRFLFHSFISYSPLFRFFFPPIFVYIKVYLFNFHNVADSLDAKRCSDPNFPPPLNVYYHLKSI